MKKDNDKRETAMSAPNSGSASLPKTRLGCLLYISRWKRRQRMICKATIKAGHKITEIELFGDELHPPNDNHETEEPRRKL